MPLTVCVPIELPGAWVAPVLRMRLSVSPMPMSVAPLDTVKLEDDMSASSTIVPAWTLVGPEKALPPVKVQVEESILLRVEKAWYLPNGSSSLASNAPSVVPPSCKVLAMLVPSTFPVTVAPECRVSVLPAPLKKIAAAPLPPATVPSEPTVICDPLIAPMP